MEWMGWKQLVLRALQPYCNDHRSSRLRWSGALDQGKYHKVTYAFTVFGQRSMCNMKPTPQCQMAEVHAEAPLRRSLKRDL